MIDPAGTQATDRLDLIAAGVRRRLERQLDDLRVQGEAGGGMVRVEISASGRPLRIEIDPALKCVEMIVPLEDLVLAAFADAERRARRDRTRILEHGRHEILQAAIGILRET
jgi:DNA-binding protein YbaB